MRESDEARKILSERIRTYRSLLQDELLARKMSCIEMTPAGQNDPVYFRIKEGNTMPQLDVNMVVTILREIDNEQLHTFADKNGHDLPKMLAAMLNAKIKDRYSKKNGKPSLSISNTKERGYVRQHSTPDDVIQLAKNLYVARNELAQLRNISKQRKEAHVHDQRNVEEQVKAILKEKDPVNQMTRVHMTQDGDEWVYYLRCKETVRKPTVGVRKIVPMVEDALVKTLQSQGLGREFNSQFCPTVQFWEEVVKHLSSSFDDALHATKTTSSLTLDRGAPRTRKLSECV